MKKSVQIDYLSDIDKIFDDHYIQDVTYVAPIDMEVEFGDIVLVERYRGAMTIGQVRSVHEYDSEQPNASKVRLMCWLSLRTVVRCSNRNTMMWQERVSRAKLVIVYVS
jgi:hypothetical protein